MALPYVVDAARRPAIVTSPGRVTGRDIATTIQALYEDPSWEPGYNVIWDASGNTELLMESEDIQGFVALQRDFLPVAGEGRDVVIAHRAIDETMVRIYILAAKAVRPTYLARSLDEALRILASPPPTG